jgi:hypothetical protein
MCETGGVVGVGCVVCSGGHELPAACRRAQPGDHEALGVRPRDPKEPSGAPRRCLGVAEGLAANMAARGAVWVGCLGVAKLEEGAE